MNLTTEVFIEHEVDKDDPNLEENYPPHGEENSAVLLVYHDDDCEDFEVLSSTGRYFHAMWGCAGYSGMELGIGDIPSKAGMYLFSNGAVNVGEDYCEIDGDVERLSSDSEICKELQADIDDRLLDRLVYGYEDIRSIFEEYYSWNVNKKPAVKDRTEYFGEGNKGGSYFEISHADDDHAMVSVGSHCITVCNEVVPVVWLSEAMDTVFSRVGGIRQFLIDNSPSGNSFALETAPQRKKYI